ncbi:LOW QUALITY PROTEIN: major histocompatibility complex class I-related gene protein-like [Alosa alosa]|uniref:LOW QUALITY PROTEIN: major histocompatibility complex class I-related gene protein-like n=1 Tax=Alosa alosa TaxID=278164 RepID=UPI0020152559|nr:LOW QUALITY PROTEIN: major histocompatibility complex class I-related gene protein-like [Alosa alosa]
MNKCLILIYFLSRYGGVNAGSHSLWMMATYIRGKTPFPEFTGYVMLDDIIFGYYDSIENKIKHRDISPASVRGADTDDMSFVGYFVGYVHGSMKDRASYLKNYFNDTNDIYVFQRVAGCELLDDESGGVMISKDAYNGDTVEVDHYDVDNDALRIERRWSNMENEGWTHSMDFPLRYRMIYHPNCIKFLKKHLAKERNRVLKKVKPRVRVLQRVLPCSAGVLLTCLATGFYPRHINLTLLRDGQPVSDHQITGGELLPNGDETYQMRKSLEVSAEELQHHHYTCTAEHLSLDNKLDIDLESVVYRTNKTPTPPPPPHRSDGNRYQTPTSPRSDGNRYQTPDLRPTTLTNTFPAGNPERDWDLVTTPIMSSALVTVLAVCCLVGAGIGVIIRWRRKCADKGSQTAVSSNYSAASI